jgi:hypothetical protein
VIQSEFLRDSFARVKAKQASSTLSASYASIGVGGASTLIEIFDVNTPPLPGLRSAVVFSFEQSGEIDEVYRRLARCVDTPLRHELVERKSDPNAPGVPWYTLVMPNYGERASFTTFFSEVTRSYYQSLGAGFGPQGELLRSAYLDAAMGLRVRPDQHLRDVIGASWRLEQAHLDLFVACMADLDYRVERRGGEVVVSGPQATLRLESAEGRPSGVTELRLALARPLPAGTSLRFGARSELRAEDDATAVWTFEPAVPSVA